MASCEYEDFIACLQETHELPSALRELRESLVNQYPDVFLYAQGQSPAFLSAQQAKRWAKKQNHAKQNDKTGPPRIGKGDLCKTDIVKKKFLTLLNKISPTNAASIIRQISVLILEEHLIDELQMLWDLMSKQSTLAKEYMKVLEEIVRVEKFSVTARQFFVNQWETAKENQSYILPVQYANLDPEHNYDLYCEAVKWKKEASGRATAIALWGCFLPGVVSVPMDLITILVKLVDSNSNLTQSPPSQSVVESTIDQLLSVAKIGNKVLRDHLRVMINNASMPSDASLSGSSRFKLQDIREILH